jgi:hypothetical protein
MRQPPRGNSAGSLLVVAGDPNRLASQERGPLPRLTRKSVRVALAGRAASGELANCPVPHAAHSRGQCAVDGERDEHDHQGQTDIGDRLEQPPTQIVDAARLTTSASPRRLVVRSRDGASCQLAARAARRAASSSEGSSDGENSTSTRLDSTSRRTFPTAMPKTPWPWETRSMTSSSEVQR